MRIHLSGRRWNLRVVPRLDADGDCDPPTAPNKTIRIAGRLRGERRLAVLLHECLHACLWNLDEDAVEHIAADIAHVLWRLGYRA